MQQLFHAIVSGDFPAKSKNFAVLGVIKNLNFPKK
jgi:hypothetical protein